MEIATAGGAVNHLKGMHAQLVSVELEALFLEISNWWHLQF